MAEAILTVAGLYKDGILPKPQNYAYPFSRSPYLPRCSNNDRQELFVMFLEHRMRTFQGTFHVNPNYSLWYGWSEMQRSVTEIKEKAAEMLKNTRSKKKPLFPSVLGRTDLVKACLPACRGVGEDYKGGRKTDDTTLSRASEEMLPINERDHD